MNLRFRINLTESQRRAYSTFKDKATKELVLVWSRQCGKSTLCKVLMIETLLSKRTNVFYVTPDFTLGKSIYKEVLNMLLPTGLVTHKNSTDLTIELFNGSLLKFFSVKNINSMRGQTCRGLLILDEVAHMPDETPDGQDIWNMIIRPVTKARKPKVVFVSTPHGKSGLFYDKYVESLSSDGVKSIVATVYDDRLMDEATLASWKASTPPRAFAQEFECKFLDNAGTAFEGFEDCFMDYGSDEVRNDEPVWIGVDFSTSGEDSTIVTVLNNAGRIRQHKVSGDLDTKYSRIAEIVDSYPNLRMAYMEANSIGEPMINSIRKLVRRNKPKIQYWTTTHTTKNAMVGRLQLLVARHEVSFDRADRELFQEFAWFEIQYNRKTNTVTYGAKSPRHDDRIMSLMMAVEAREARPAASGSRYAFVGNPVTRVQ